MKFFSCKKRLNTAICDINISQEYHAKQNKSNEKSQEPFDFTL